MAGCTQKLSWCLELQNNVVGSTGINKCMFVNSWLHNDKFVFINSW